jgi:hypothetical protein
MPAKELSDRRKREDAARKLCDEAAELAKRTSDETIKQAGIVYEKAKQLAVNDQAMKEVAKAYEEAVKQAEEVRHKIAWQAQVVFAHTWAQSDKDYQEALTKTKERIDSAQKTYNEAKKQAELVYEQAKKLGAGKQLKEAANTHKKAIKQAEKDYHEAITKSR